MPTTFNYYFILKFLVVKYIFLWSFYISISGVFIWILVALTPINISSFTCYHERSSPGWAEDAHLCLSSQEALLPDPMCCHHPYPYRSIPPNPFIGRRFNLIRSTHSVCWLVTISARRRFQENGVLRKRQQKKWKRKQEKKSLLTMVVTPADILLLLVPLGAANKSGFANSWRGW